MLGQSSLIIGDPATAEKEFRKAAEFGHPPALVVPLIAQAMLDNGESEKVMSEFGERKLDDPQAEAALRVVVGQAQLRTSKLDASAASFAAALASDPSNVQAGLGQARIAAFAGKLDEATAAVDQIVAKHPKSSDALMLQGALKLARGDREGAGGRGDHDLRLIMQLCERIHVLNEGRTVAEGEPQEVATDPAVVEAYLGRPRTGEPSTEDPVEG